MLPLVLLVGCHGGVEPPRRPDIVLISLDTTRADAIGVYGDAGSWRPDIPARQRPVPSTPRVDAIAGRGVRLSWAL
ncbi:MAG: hypothetical protein D6798_03205, partial [Deltaproteobacteria bacterium]